MSRREVSIARELSGNRIPIRHLSRREGQKALDAARAAILTRYRELYGFSWGDPSTVRSADCGRGLEILLFGLIPERRLPLRAGFAPLLIRNGIPIGYADAFGVCERMEISFNIFYAFRDGESAWCFARMLALYHQLFGSKVFSIDPYQIGFENEEAIDAGAFWFYRKLGFRSTSEHIERIASREEEMMQRNSNHRTAAAVLRRMARSPMLFETEAAVKGAWDDFHIREISSRIEKEFSRAQGGASSFNHWKTIELQGALGITVASLSRNEATALDRMAPVLTLIPDLDRWSQAERDGLRSVIRAKGARDERRYLQLLARHSRLRRALLRLGR